MEHGVLCIHVGAFSDNTLRSIASNFKHMEYCGLECRKSSHASHHQENTYVYIDKQQEVYKKTPLPLCLCSYYQYTYICGSIWTFFKRAIDRLSSCWLGQRHTPRCHASCNLIGMFWLLLVIRFYIESFRSFIKIFIHLGHTQN